MKTFKILGFLLTYPDEQYQANLKTITQRLKNENILAKKDIKAIDTFIQVQQSTDLITLQEHYVNTFDKGRSHCLNLFEHIYGDSRDRGQAMVDLAQMYHQKGWHINSKELPDFLPLLLEYLSLCDMETAKDILTDMAHIIATIAVKLKKNNSGYCVIFEALERLSNAKISKQIKAQALNDLAKEDNSLEALDKQWQEVAAFDNQTNDDCNDCHSTPDFSPEQKITIGG